MTRNFLLAAASVVIMATSFAAAPAKAEGRDLFNFVAGATALVILSEAINHNAHPHHGYRHGHAHRPGRRPMHFHGNFRHRHPHRRAHRHSARRGGYWQR